MSMKFQHVSHYTGRPLLWLNISLQLSCWRRRLRRQAVEIQLIMHPSCPWLVTKDSSSWIVCTCQCIWDKRQWELMCKIGIGGKWMGMCSSVVVSKTAERRVYLWPITGSWHVSEWMTVFVNKDPVVDSCPKPEIRVYKSRPTMSKFGLFFLVDQQSEKLRSSIYVKKTLSSSAGDYGKRGI